MGGAEQPLGLAVSRPPAGGDAERVEVANPIASDMAVLRRSLRLAAGARAHIPVGRDAPLEEFAAVAPRVPVFRITAGPEPAAT